MKEKETEKKGLDETDMAELDKMLEFAVQDFLPDSGTEETPDEENIYEKLLSSMEELHQTFEQKIAADEHKNQMIDKMHEELTNYRNGLVDKPLEEVAVDIIRMNDGLKQSVARYESADMTEENYRKVLGILKGVIEDQEDLLYRQGIEPYSVEGNQVDIRRQKTIGTIETDEESLHQSVAERTVCGYERNGKIIRPERIKTYQYVAKEENNDK